MYSVSVPGYRRAFPVSDIEDDGEIHNRTLAIALCRYSLKPTMWGGVALTGHPTSQTAPLSITQRHRRDWSAVISSTSTTIGTAAGAAEAITGAVDLVTERVDVQDVEAEATSSDAAIAAHAAIAATAATATGTKQ
jgi:hypothetical protein